MLSEINRICDTYTYIPVLTEIQGLTEIATGAIVLGASGNIKFSEYYTGKKERLPFVSEDAGQFSAEVGISCAKSGLKRIAPTTGVILVIYILSARLLFR